ncbi:hypothetical protein INR77_08890 [Erythrobacter sp. SCSIO 43205]|uniref:head-tail joining protein n=1 Tax=Erythrobacter sp. SCSIO 43205 TaxID=2779361 RepID=UPI001CA86E59|nr:hypothetical protein [Erythrobacter sp. SCSIO 43205]UAB76963.1 hypothetical protein INR77_08890 [Erythrobacter sp. SCSIO 43205]
MFAQAFANIATAFSDTNGAPFVDAVAVWQGSPTYDDGGSITSPGTASEYPCKAQLDAPTQQMRAAEGFLETDVRVLVLSSSLAVELDTAAQITADGETYALLTCQRDAAGIGYECRGRKVV